MATPEVTAMAQALAIALKAVGFGGELKDDKPKEDWKKKIEEKSFR